MKRIIALAGGEKAGKTATVRECVRLLVKRFGLEALGAEVRHPKRGYGAIQVEVLISVRINGKTVVLNTIGDTREQVGNAVAFAKEKQADLLVTAVRARSRAARQPIDAYAAEAKIVPEFWEKPYSAQKCDFDRDNNRLAERLVEAILTFCNA